MVKFLDNPESYNNVEMLQDLDTEVQHFLHCLNFQNIYMCYSKYAKSVNTRIY